MRNLKGVNLYLIGMMGAGKSTLGKALAAQLGYRFIDTDTVIEQATGQSITELFAAGEAAFRELETQVLGQVAAYPKMTIATGGGIILKRQNWSYLRHGIVVWLDAPIEVLCDRLQTDTTRPILQGGDLSQKLQLLLDQRQSLYAQADVRIPIRANESPAELAQRVLAEIQTVLKPEVTPPSASDFTIDRPLD
jgi:shikimate kinase